MSTSTQTPNTQPSAGAMRAATRIMTADDPARFAADFAAEQEREELARIIDEETGAGELAKALRDARASFLGLQPDFGGPIAAQMGKAVERINAVLSRYTSAKENPTP